MIKNRISPFLLIIAIDTAVAGIIIPVLGPAIMASDSILVPVGASLTLRYLIYSMVLSSFFIFSFLGTPILGSLSDIYGRKRVLIYCAIAKSAGLLLTAFAFINGNLLLLIVSRIIAGSASSTVSISQACIASLSAERNKAKNLGLAAMAAALGFLLGPILTAFFVNTNIYSGFSISTPFFVATALPLISILFLALFVVEKNLPIEIPLNWRNLLRDIVESAKAKQNRPILAGILVLGVAWGYFFLSISPYLTLMLGYSSADIAIVITYAASLYIVAAAVFVPLSSKHMGLAKSVVVSSVAIVLGAILLFFFNSEILLWAGVGLAVVGFGVCAPIMLTMISNLYADAEQGKVMGISISVQSFSIAVSAMSVGFISAIAVVLPYVLIIFFAAIIIAIFCKYS